MSISRKLMTTGGDEPTYVDDVFSTYLYTGTGADRDVTNGINMGDTGHGTSTLFDGVADGLVKASDLTGNADGRKFTFSAWVKPEAGGGGVVYAAYDGTSSAFSVAYNESNQRFDISASGGSVFAWQTPNGTCPPGRWYHLLVSGDLDNITPKKHLYVNDVANEQFNTTLNFVDIQFSQPDHRIGRGENAYGFLNAAMAHIYLDYTYRDLSIESNRRLFNDGASSSVSSSSLSALSPILYMPLGEAGLVNSGTGGDFTAEGSPSLKNTGVEVGEGRGGLVWLKSRDQARPHTWFDTERGVLGGQLQSNTTNGELYQADRHVTGFNADGFSIGLGDSDTNSTNYLYASWSFAKQKGFFDIVTYTGDGVDGREIPHNLGSKPGMIIAKCLTDSNNWRVYHRSLGADYWLQLNTPADAVGPSPNIWYSTEPTSEVFTVADTGSINGLGDEFVAYLFAHDAQEFGPNGDESIIKCGSYTGTGAAGNEIDLGFEPQWLLIKNSADATDWYLQDTMRGLGASDGTQRFLTANTTNAESAPAQNVLITTTGFSLNTTSSGFNSGGGEYIYMAIRRPNKPAEEFEPEELFGATTGVNGGNPTFNFGFPTDMGFHVTSTFTYLQDRLNGSRYLQTNANPAMSYSPKATWDWQEGYGNWTTSAVYPAVGFRRAPGFFDMVTYEGDGVQGRVLPHNLAAAPEMVWFKSTTDSTNWMAYHKDESTGSLSLNLSAAVTAGAVLTSTDSDMTLVANNGLYNAASQGFVAYMWASVPGLCHIGSFTGTGTDQDIDCGFTNGARFVMVKRTDDVGGWYWWDTNRGITAGNDPYSLLNTTSGVVTGTDYIDPLASGFTMTAGAATTTNIAGAEYIYMAIA